MTERGKPTPWAKASAVKSYGEYKAVIIHKDGRREILGKRERPLIWRGKDPLPGGPTHFVRGKTYPTRAEAISRAEREIAHRSAFHEARLAAFAARAQGGAT